jgi:hypothetical protein
MAIMLPRPFTSHDTACQHFALQCIDVDVNGIHNNMSTYTITELAREFDITARAIRFTKTRAC